MAVLNSSKSVFASASIAIVWQRCPQPISRWPFTIGKRLRRVAIGLIARCDGRCCLGRAGQHRLLLDGANPASVDRDRKLSTKIGYLESRLGPMREQFWHGRCRCFAGARPALASNPFVPQPCGLGSRIVKYSAGAFSFQAWRSSVPPSRLFSSSWTGNREEPAVGPAESMININRRMAQLGLCSRREANDFVKRGLVYVDGKRAEVGELVHAGAILTLHDEAALEQTSKLSVVLHKPINWISQNSEAVSEHDRSRLAVKLLTKDRCHQGWDHFLRCAIKAEKDPKSMTGIACAGRLDFESSGLLVMTQDGSVARKIVGENSRLSKEYIVDVKRISERCPTQADVKGLDLTEIWMRQDSKERSNLLRNKHPVRMSSSEEALILKNEFFFQSDDRDGADLKGEQAYERLVLEKLRHGLVIGGAALKPALVEVMDGSIASGRATLNIVLSEGKKRQIRHMCSMVGLSVTRLHRVRIGSLSLGDLPEGKWRVLRPKELDDCGRSS